MVCTSCKRNTLQRLPHSLSTLKYTVARAALRLLQRGCTSLFHEHMCQVPASRNKPREQLTAILSPFKKFGIYSGSSFERTPCLCQALQLSCRRLLVHGIIVHVVPDAKDANCRCRTCTHLEHAAGHAGLDGCQMMLSARP
jgi:hypothetical protein